MHDSRRPCKDANISCYGTIINNLEILGQSTWADKIGITIRINLDQENSQQLVDIYNALPSFIKLRDSCHNIYCSCSWSMYVFMFKSHETENRRFVKRMAHSEVK